MTQNHSDPITSQDNWPSDDSSPSNAGNPISQSEIDDLLYSGNLTVGERLGQLRAMRDDLQMQEADDVGEGDPQSLLMSIDNAIAELEALESGSDPSAVNADVDPLDHPDTLSPDDDLLLSEEIVEDELVDEDEEAAVVSDWDAENDGHDGRHGFH